MKKIRLWELIALSATSSMFACSNAGSGTASDGTIDATSSSSINSTLSAIEGLLDSTESTSASTGKTRTQSVAGDKSFAGCHYDLDLKRMLTNFDRIRGPICAISTLDEKSENFNVLP